MAPCVVVIVTANRIATNAVGGLGICRVRIYRHRKPPESAHRCADFRRRPAKRDRRSGSTLMTSGT